MAPRFIISGGGTGGHIFPAIAIADALKKAMPKSEILFVGALGRMEMERVPAAGYEIVGLPVAGFQRRISFKNITFFFKLAASMLKARKIIKIFRPHVVIGVGGYASGPVLRAASSKGIPTLIQEQNSFPGVTNRILAKKSSTICVAYPNMEKFFPGDKILFTGNPIRSNLLNSIDPKDAYLFFGLNPSMKTILVIGGSLGAGSVNKGILNYISNIKNKDVQILWQTGKNYYQDVSAALDTLDIKNVKVQPFIKEMDSAYALADIVVSRAGAGTISELALLGKASILVPSPNVSEDHQTKNAMALVEKGAALLVKDADAPQSLLKTALELLTDEPKCKMLASNISHFARPNADKDIAQEVIKLGGF